MAGIEQSLRTLRDVQGVYGSFVIAGTGALVASDLPAAFDGDLFEEVGPRVMRLYETFLSGAEELDACMLRFAEHKIYLRKMTWGVIGILSAVAVNMPALRMVANLVIRKIDPEVVPSLRPTLPPVAIEVPKTPPPPVALPTVSVATAPASFRPPAPRPVERPTPVPEESVVAATNEIIAPAASTRHVRMYRGRPVVDDE
jgi:predicted regulator of Ras-like GTPase activity (Roadblock/LC7/MglB family)